jgi:hypothetical protein
MMIRVIERATGIEYTAEAIDGGYLLNTLEGEKYKKLRESTFKRNYKVVKEEDQQAAPKAEPITAEKREKMIEKIKKMLALAQDNPSMEEGLSAALQAHKLMAKYNIHEDDVTLEEVKDEILSVFSTQPHDSHLMGWRKPLGAVVATAFRCKCYLSGKDVVFRGYKDDAKLAMDVFLMLYAVGHKLAKKTESSERTKTGSAKGVYTSVATGFVKGAQDAFNEQCTALLVVTPKEVEEDWTQFSANFKKSTRTHMGVKDYEAFKTGYSEGKQAVKSRAIEGKEN